MKYPDISALGCQFDFHHIKDIRSHHIAIKLNDEHGHLFYDNDDNYYIYYYIDDILSYARQQNTFKKNVKFRYVASELIVSNDVIWDFYKNDIWNHNLTYSLLYIINARVYKNGWLDDINQDLIVISVL